MVSATPVAIEGRAPAYPRDGGPARLSVGAILAAGTLLLLLASTLTLLVAGAGCPPRDIQVSRIN